MVTAEVELRYFVLVAQWIHIMAPVSIKNRRSLSLFTHIWVFGISLGKTFLLEPDSFDSPWHTSNIEQS